MEYIFLAMASGYEDTKVFGVYTDLDKALDVAEQAAKDVPYSEGFNDSYVAKAKVNGKIVCYYLRDKNTGEILNIKV